MKMNLVKMSGKEGIMATSDLCGPSGSPQGGSILSGEDSLPSELVDITGIT
jgi:hypothetical protein